MEVKIKIGDEMIDAKIVMMNGDMIVSPKVVKFEPKDGDVVTVYDGQHVFINKDYQKCGVGYAYLGWNFDNGKKFREGLWNYNRYATEEEKKLLFDKLAEEGYSWDAERKELVKLKWKPKEDEEYYFPIFDSPKGFCVTQHKWCKSYINDKLDKKGWVFKTEQECQEFCNRLNEAINSVKP